jgi:hypothetical protein
MMNVKNEGYLPATNVTVDCEITTSFAGQKDPSKRNRISGMTQHYDVSPRINWKDEKTLPCFHQLTVSGESMDSEIQPSRYLSTM